MKRKLLRLLLIMVIGTLLLVGCGGNENIENGSDANRDSGNVQENIYIENGITIDGKMYDFHMDGILDSELEEIIPIMAQEEDSTVEQVIEYLSGIDKERAFEKVEEVRVENDINHINRIVLTSEDVDFAIEVVVNLDEVYMDREYVLEEKYEGPAYGLALKRNVDKWTSDSDTFTIAFGKDELSIEDYIEYYIQYYKEEENIDVRATEVINFEAAGYTWERFNWIQETSSTGIDKETLEEVTITGDGYLCELGVKIQEGYLSFTPHEDYLRGSDIGETWEEIVKECILEINIIEEE